MAVVVGTGSLLLFLSLSVNLVALLVPYWANDGGVLGLGARSVGLWGKCSCQYYYHSIEDISENGLEAWEKSVQMLFALGVVFIAVAMLVVFISSCCSDKSSGKIFVAAGSLILVGAVLIAVATIIFGVKGHDDRGYQIDDSGKRFMWGMWLAVAGFGIALITAIVFLVQGTRVTG